jgi:hypothetical protein
MKKINCLRYYNGICEYHGLAWGIKCYYNTGRCNNKINIGKYKEGDKIQTKDLKTLLNEGYKLKGDTISVPNSGNTMSLGYALEITDKHFTILYQETDGQDRWRVKNEINQYIIYGDEIK